MAVDARVDALGSLEASDVRTLVVPAGTSVDWEYKFRAGAVFEVLGVTGDEGDYVLATEPNAKAPGTYTVAGDDDEAQIVAFPRPSEAPQSLTLRYHVQGAALRYRDTSEFSWPFISETEKLPIDSVRIHVVLPGEVPAADVSGWANGPLYSDATVNADGSVDAVAPELPAKTEVEVRVLFPSDALPDRFKSPWQRTADVEEFENDMAVQIGVARFMDHARHAIGWFFGILTPIVALAYTMAYRWGRRDEFRPAYQGEYYAEQPADVMPAMVSAFMPGEIDADAVISATIADLVGRNVLSLDCPDSDIASCRLSRSGGGLPEHVTRSEKYFVKALFDEVVRADAFTLGDLRQQLSTEDGARAWSRLRDEFQHRVGNELVLRRLLEHRVTYAGTGFMWLAVVTLGVGLIAQSMAEWPPLVVLALLASPVVVLLARTMRFVTQRSEDLAGKYRGLRGYLRDLSSHADPLPASPREWRGLLTLAVLFGLAEGTVATLGERDPQTAGEIGTNRWVWASEFGKVLAGRESSVDR